MATPRRSPVRSVPLAVAVAVGLAGTSLAAAPPKGPTLDPDFGLPPTGGVVYDRDLVIPPAALASPLTLNEYIKGTVAHVRDQVNGPLEALMAKKAERTAKRDQLKADEAERSAKVVANLYGSSDSFRQTDDELTAAKKAVESAKTGHDGAGMMAASQRVTKAQEDERAQVDAVLSKDPDVVANRAEAAKLAGQISGMADPIAKASKAREQTLDSIRNSTAIQGPPKDGATGTIRKIKVTKIVDEHSLVGECLFVERVAEDTKMARPDGLKVYSGRLYKVPVLVTGIDTAGLKEKTTVDFDETFKLDGHKTVGKADCLVANKVGGQSVDVIFAILDPLKVPEGTEKTAAK